MKKTITALIAILLLALPIAQAEPAASGQTDVGAPDLTEKCRGTLFVKSGDLVSLCSEELTVSSVNEDSITINQKQILNGESQDINGIEITYGRYNSNTNEARIIFDKISEKVVSTFEKDSLKVFYGDAATFAGSADAQTENLAEIEYGAEQATAENINKATLAIRSLSPYEVVLGLDFEGQDPENAENTLSEQLHLSYVLDRMDIKALDLERSTYTSLYPIPKLFSFVKSEEPNKIKLLLGQSEYALEIIEFDGLHAIKISGPEFTVQTENGPQVTSSLLITTKLARLGQSEKSCRHDVAGSALDDFKRKSSVQGLYPSYPEFFGVFEDYCKDDKTLVNYGCMGLRSDFERTSRVTFLEITCPKCENGACARGPYCSDSDKYSDSPQTSDMDESIYTKGKLTIYGRTPSLNINEAAEITRLQSLYNYGMDISKKTDFHDECKEGKLVEYKCDPAKTEGYVALTVNCPEGSSCEGGRCLISSERQPVTPPETEIATGERPAEQPSAEAECTADEDCANGESCIDGKCEGIVGAGSYQPECTTDAQCGAGRRCREPGLCENIPAELSEDQLESLRDELKTLDKLIEDLQGRRTTAPPGTSGITEFIPGAGIAGGVRDITKTTTLGERLRGLFGLEPTLPPTTEPGPAPLPIPVGGFRGLIGLGPTATDYARQGATVQTMVQRGIDLDDALEARSDATGDPQKSMGELADAAAQGDVGMNVATREMVSFAQDNDVSLAQTTRIIISSAEKENIDPTSAAQVIANAAVKEGATNTEVAKALATTVGVDTTRQALTTTIGASATSTALTQAGLTTTRTATTVPTTTTVPIATRTGTLAPTSTRVIAPTTQQVSGLKSMISGTPRI